MRIAHISDIHIRNLKYHDEYRRVFDDLYTRLYALKPDLIINTGDTAHTKTQISPEFVQMASEFMQALSAIAPTHIILGNHDLNLMNPDRQDAITPIVDSLAIDRLYLHKKSGLAADYGIFKFWAFSMADPKHYPGPNSYDQSDVNIGLFHGSVAGCVTDLNWRMTNVEHQLDIFDGLDYALLGDIHKQQSFRGGRIAYAGSLIQQNFGEEIEKGFLLWDIMGKDEFTCQRIPLKGSRKFYTIRLNDDLSLPDTQVEEGSRVRISPPKQITLAQQKEIERNVRRVYKPFDVITLSATDIGTQKVLTRDGQESVENIRKLEVQERLIREHLEGKELPDHILQRVLELNRKYQVHIEQEDDTPRNIKWKLDRIAWSNFFNYGEENYVELAAIPGLTGIFGPNGSGKSAFIDVILETLYDNITKNVSKNISLINDNKETASAVAQISVNGQRYQVDREVSRIRYGQKKFDETREWGRTSTTFSLVDEAGALEPLTGMTRPETERSIRSKIGSYEDFTLTSLVAQWNPNDIIACKETKRKEILYRFFDLDIFAEKGELAKRESKELFEKLQRLEDDGLDKIIASFRAKVEEQGRLLEEKSEQLKIAEHSKAEIQSKVESLRSVRPNIKVTGKSEDWDRKIEKASIEIKGLEKQLDMLSLVKDGSDEMLQIAETAERHFDMHEHEEREKELEEVLGEIEALEDMVKEHRRGVQEFEKKARTLSEVPCGDQYPGCKFLIDAFEARQSLPIARENLGTRERALELTRLRVPDLQRSAKALKEHREMLSKKETWRLLSDKRKLEMENIRLKISGLKSSQDVWAEEKAAWERAEDDRLRAEQIDSEIRQWDLEKRNLDKVISGFRADVGELNRELGSAQGILDKLTGQMAELQEIRDACRAFELFQDAMGKDGIALKILVQKLPVLNEQVNKILANAADFGVTVDFDVQEQSVNFFMQYGQYKSRILELAGGAEKFLASLAIRAALLGMSNLPTTNALIVDEGFGKLDPKSLENIQRMFEYLRTVFDHVIVISHVETMKDIVDNIVEITSDHEGYAHVTIGGRDAD